jgi:hypothetical protein
VPPAGPAGRALDQAYLVLKSVSAPNLSLGCHIDFVAKSFDPNFYIVCATVIPVLFLAVAVQGSAYKTVLEAAMTAARTKTSGGWTHQLRALALSRTLQLIGYAIWCAGALGEVLALMVLYQDPEDSGTRITVFLATVFLTFVVGAGPLRAYAQVRSAIWRQRGALPDDLSETESVTPQQPGQPSPLSPQPSDP